MVPTPTLKAVTIYSERIRGTFLRMLGNCPKLGEGGGGGLEIVPNLQPQASSPYSNEGIQY